MQGMFWAMPPSLEEYFKAAGATMACNKEMEEGRDESKEDKAKVKQWEKKYSLIPCFIYY